jgi:formylglycine-generating enzyme required for sulfatase activity
MSFGTDLAVYISVFGSPGNPLSPRGPQVAGIFCAWYWTSSENGSQSGLNQPGIPWLKDAARAPVSRSERIGQFRVLRGGSWHDSAGLMRVTTRGSIEPTIRDAFIEFRWGREASH